MYIMEILSKIYLVKKRRKKKEEERNESTLTDSNRIVLGASKN